MGMMTHKQYLKKEDEKKAISKDEKKKGLVTTESKKKVYVFESMLGVDGEATFEINGKVYDVPLKKGVAQLGKGVTSEILIKAGFKEVVEGESGSSEESFTKYEFAHSDRSDNGNGPTAKIPLDSKKTVEMVNGLVTVSNKKDAEKLKAMGYLLLARS